MGAGMRTGFAALRSLGAFMQPAAVPAAPDHRLVALEHLLLLDVGEQGAIAFLVVFFGHGNRRKDPRYFRETFVARGGGKVRVHAGTFVLLPSCGITQIGGRAADDAGGEAGGNFDLSPLQHLEQPLGVLALLIGGFLEDGGNLLESFLVGLLGILGVAVAGLALAGKSGENIFFGLGAIEGHAGSFLNEQNECEY